MSSEDTSPEEPRVSPAGRWLAIGFFLLVPLGVASIAIPNVLNARDRGRQKTTMVTLRSVGVALAAYREAEGTFPACAGCTTWPLREHLEPRFMDKVPLEDPWGHRIGYTASQDSYVLWSYGRDGLPQRFPYGGGAEGVDIDIVFFNGGLWQGPHGRCGGYPNEVFDPFLVVAMERRGTEAGPVPVVESQ